MAGDELLPIETDPFLGKPVESGFSIPVSHDCHEMGIHDLSVYLSEGTDFVTIASMSAEDDVGFDIANIDHVIDALTRIRDARAAIFA